MGTNYYVHYEENPQFHIGKSSGGWCFSLRVYPDKGIETLEDWKPIFENNKIETEYGQPITKEDMLTVITKRAGGFDPSNEERIPYAYDFWEAFWDAHNAKPGPDGLLRAKVDGVHCIGHGEGTWDYMIGSFS